jgi:D-alanyl-D-alanine carboxypeptidase (penicillin-binding protein 5/6)
MHRSRLFFPLALLSLMLGTAADALSAESTKKSTAASASKTTSKTPPKTSASKGASTSTAPKNTASARPSKTSASDDDATDSAGRPVIRTSRVSAILIDAKNGSVLHALNADQPRPVASTQKLMTALLVAEAGNLEKIVTIQASDTWAEPSKLDIKPGETYRRADLLRVLLIKSMNDVARALARDNAGSVEAFAEKMNARAEQLGMKNSHFVNPNGLPSPSQHSTARDMARVAAAAYKNSTIRSIVKMKDLQWRHPDGHVSEFHNTNRVLTSLPACNGMKTGYTQAAGFCLISSASADGRDVIAVVLGDSKPQIWTDSHRLLAWGLRSDARSAETP